MTLTIRTNRHRRDILDWWQLTANEQAEFDYLDTETRQSDASFFRYRGDVYDLGEFRLAQANMFPAGWDGYQSDSFYSGLLIRYVDDWERVIVATYFS